SLGKPADFGGKRLVLDGFGQEAERSGLVGRETAPQHHELLRLRLAENADEPLASAGAGHEAQVDLRLSEPRSLRGDPEIARQGQFEASSETMAVDRRDGRLGEICKPEEDLLRTTGGPPHLERLR